MNIIIIFIQALFFRIVFSYYNNNYKVNKKIILNSIENNKIWTPDSWKNSKVYQDVVYNDKEKS